MINTGELLIFGSVRCYRMRFEMGQNSEDLMGSATEMNRSDGDGFCDFMGLEFKVCLIVEKNVGKAYH
jgi:hypothetical protein